MKSYLVLFVVLQLFFFTNSSLTSLSESHNKKNLNRKKTKCRKAAQTKCRKDLSGCSKDSQCCSGNCEWGTCKR